MSLMDDNPLKSFDRVSFIEDLRPDWSDWQGYPRISLKFLCYLAHEYDPKKFYSQLDIVEEYKKKWAKLGCEIFIIPLFYKEEDATQKGQILNLKVQQRKLDKLITDYDFFKHKILDEVEPLYDHILFLINERVIDPSRHYHSITYPEYDQITLDPDNFSDWLYHHGTPVFPKGLEEYLTSNKDNPSKLKPHTNYHYDEQERSWEEWEQEKEVKIKDYSKGMFSVQWEPDWSYWRSLEVISLEHLCYLVFDVDPKKIIKDYESVHDKSKNHYIEMIAIHKHAVRLYERAESSIIAKKLEAEKYDSQLHLDATTFIDWLKINDITFSEGIQVTSRNGDLHPVELIPVVMRLLDINPMAYKSYHGFKVYLFKQCVEYYPDKFDVNKQKAFTTGGDCQFNRAIKQKLIKEFKKEVIPDNT